MPSKNQSCGCSCITDLRWTLAPAVIMDFQVEQSCLGIGPRKSLAQAMALSCQQYIIVRARTSLAASDLDLFLGSVETLGTDSADYKKNPNIVDLVESCTCRIGYLSHEEWAFALETRKDYKQAFGKCCSPCFEPPNALLGFRNNYRTVGWWVKLSTTVLAGLHNKSSHKSSHNSTYSLIIHCRRLCKLQTDFLGPLVFQLGSQFVGLM